MPGFLEALRDIIDVQFAEGDCVDVVSVATSVNTDGDGNVVDETLSVAGYLGAWKITEFDVTLTPNGAVQVYVVTIDADGVVETLDSTLQIFTPAETTINVVAGPPICKCSDSTWNGTCTKTNCEDGITCGRNGYSCGYYAQSVPVSD